MALKMNLNLKLSQKLPLLIAGAAFLTGLAIGGVALWGMIAQSRGLSEVEMMSGALGDHLGADQMHDALRADVLTALRAGPGATSQKREEILADLEDHIANFGDFIAANAARPLDEATKKALADVGPRLDSYLASAQEIVGLALKDTAAAESRFDAFTGAFRELESAMAAVSDEISASAAATSASAAASAGLARLVLVVGGLAIVIVVGVIGVYVSRGISRPIGAATAAMAKLSKGEDEFEITDDKRGDEIGDMWKAMRTLRETVRKAFELTQVMQEIPINVIQCEPRNFTVTFANKASIATLTKLEQFLPIRASELIGKSIDIFHKDPGHQRRLLSDPKNLPYSTKIKLGPETLALNVAAIMDKHGGYMGPVLTWNVVTAQVGMANKVKDVVGIVASAATEMEATAQGMSATAEETNRQATAVAAASEEAATNVQTVAAATEELSASIREISQQVTQSTKISGEAVQEIERTNVTVKGLAEAAQKIGEVVKIINDIAGQTNLLALNATIEAARAGEAGKGFAVVASEVKTLANQTAKATEEIGTQIANIQAATGRSVEAIQGIGGTIARINEIATAIASAVEEQGAATLEISRNVQQAAAGTQDVSANIGGVSMAATQTGEASSQVLDAARELAKHGVNLNGEIEQFLKSI
jgi:methyl-accepting chemotaxis protein